jgi:hypothetical protein
MDHRLKAVELAGLILCWGKNVKASHHMASLTPGQRVEGSGRSEEDRQGKREDELCGFTS